MVLEEREWLPSSPHGELIPFFVKRQHAYHIICAGWAEREPRETILLALQPTHIYALRAVAIYGCIACL